MIDKLLSNGAAILQAAATTAAGTTEVDGAEIDMSAYEGVLFVVKFGTAAADNTISLQQTDTTTSYSADIAGSLITPGASDEIVWVDLYRPTSRYVRVQVQRGTSSTLDWAVAIRYGSHKGPVDNTTSGTIYGETLVSPADGTA